MFSLLHGTYKYLFAPKRFAVVILGLDNAGKTTLLEKTKQILTDGPTIDPSRIIPTVGLNIGNVHVNKVEINFWDLGGEAGLRGIWNRYIEDANAYIFCVDATDESRFDEALRVFNDLMRRSETDERPVLILANKCEEDSSHSAREIQDVLQILDSRGDRERFKILSVSAKTGYIKSQ